uniref:Bm9177 n=1 Tax=Brugia malayi TaxID=6279 RepID=A0A1I9G0Q2_BRUMA|nr:Bm9177 [Brugia malayi]
MHKEAKRLHSVSNTKIAEDRERKVDENNCPDEVTGIAIDVAVVTNGGAAAVRD